MNPPIQRVASHLIQKVVDLEQISH
jgi:hypothetical protein